jgi:hypothetical protein
VRQRLKQIWVWTTQPSASGARLSSPALQHLRCARCENVIPGSTSLDSYDWDRCGCADLGVYIGGSSE